MQKEHKTPFSSHAHLLQESSQLFYFQFAISKLLITGSNKQDCGVLKFFKDPVQFPLIFCKLIVFIKSRACLATGWMLLTPKRDFPQPFNLAGPILAFQIAFGTSTDSLHTDMVRVKSF